MRHRIVAVLLEQKRAELGEDKTTFALRIFPECANDVALTQYILIAKQRADIRECRLPYAAAVLEIPLDKLKTY